MKKRKQQRLRGQTCIVTGANSGIGEAIALAMGADGANVTVNYRSRPQDAEKVVRKIKKFGVKAIAVQADISKKKEVKALFRKTIKTFGTVDILVNNAGVQKDAAFHKMTLKQWNQVININLTGQFLCARAAVREFLRRGMRKDVSAALGKIIHISSVHEIIPWAGHANYAASKGGITMLMQTLAQEYGPDKIRVNTIAPGAVKTSINKSAWSNEESRQKMLKLIPYKRIGEPADIGKVAAWLASDEADYVTGTSIFADGGMTCYPGFTENG